MALLLAGLVLGFILGQWVCFLLSVKMVLELHRAGVRLQLPKDELEPV